jgi:hypothetical protein
MAAPAAAHTNPAPEQVLSPRQIQNVENPIERVGLLAKWACAKITDLQTIEARIEQKQLMMGKWEQALQQTEARVAQRQAAMAQTEATLARTEQSLVKLGGELHQALAAAQPVLSELNSSTAIAAIQSALGEALAKIDARVDAGVQALPDVGGMVDAMTQRAADRIGAVTDAGEKKLADRVVRFNDDIGSTLDTIRKYMDQSIARARTDADAFVAELAGRVDELKGQVDQNLVEAREHADGMAREARMVIERQRQSDAEQIQQVLADHEAEMKATVAAAEQQLRRVMREFEVAADGANQVLDTRIASAEQALQAKLDHVSEAAKARVRKHVSLVDDEIRHTLRPALRQLEEKRQAIDIQIDGLLEAMNASVRKRLDLLREAGEALVERVERQLADRLQSLRPNAARTIEDAERESAGRLTAMIDGLRSMVLSTERELLQRIERLPGKVIDLAEAADKQLRERLATMENSSVTMTAGIEQRLAGRLDELVRESQRTLGLHVDEVEHTIDQLDQAQRAVNEMRADVRNGRGDPDHAAAVEVDVRVPAAISPWTRDEEVEDATGDPGMVL